MLAVVGTTFLHSECRASSSAASLFHHSNLHSGHVQTAQRLVYGHNESSPVVQQSEKKMDNVVLNKLRFLEKKRWIPFFFFTTIRGN